ncbi:MAG TPA: hypothetical protein VMT17_04775 [Anaeromyxobacteraceae bacterium]|nr:hypothetical protein [Anaeromyxobacteraceae bacterium]
MLATLAVLLALSAADPPLPDRPDREPPAPSSAVPGDTPGTSDEGSAAIPRRRPSPRQVTLVGAGSLGAGGAAWLTQAGYPLLEIEYAQGLNAVDDLGALAAYTWTTSEMVLGAVWRRELGATSGSRSGMRLTGGAWLDFGSGWIYPGNQSNAGIAATPGLAWTPVLGPGLLTFAADFAFTWAMARGMGLAFTPAGSIAYEFRIAPDLSAGASIYVGIRWGSGSAHIPGLDDGLQGGVNLALTWRMF